MDVAELATCGDYDGLFLCISGYIRERTKDGRWVTDRVSVGRWRSDDRDILSTLRPCTKIPPAFSCSGFPQM